MISVGCLTRAQGCLTFSRQIDGQLRLQKSGKSVRIKTTCDAAGSETFWELARISNLELGEAPV